MSARADFYCISCDELMELPLKASACPVCGGLLERRFTTAPAVMRVIDQGIEPVRAAVLENAAADEFNAQKAARTTAPGFGSMGYQAGPISQTTQTREGMKIGIPALAQAIPSDAKLDSRSISMPILHGLGRLKGPRPGPGSKSD